MINFENILFNVENYYDTDDLRYNNQYKLFFSKTNLSEYKKYKQNQISNLNKKFVKLELESFDSDSIFYVKSPVLEEQTKIYASGYVEDIRSFSSTINDRLKKDILAGKVTSEIEGSLAIENVASTRRQIDAIIRTRKINNRNDQIIANMIDAIQFVYNKPDFNEENLYKLYCILSKDCLEENQKLIDGNLYRHDAVYVGNVDHGCPHEIIKKSMDSLFKFVNEEINNKEKTSTFFDPIICHYYIVYIHPYFDYNGRTARMVSLWVSLLLNHENIWPLYISEAINDNKKKYYKAINESRNMENDLTYFMIYIINISIHYSFIYRNIEHIENVLLQDGIRLTEVDKKNIKLILTNSKFNLFDWKSFMNYQELEMTKQGTLKSLNKLLEYGVLISEEKRKVKLFKINDNFIKYKDELSV